MSKPEHCECEECEGLREENAKLRKEQDDFLSGRVIHAAHRQVLEENAELRRSLSSEESWEEVVRRTMAERNRLRDEAEQLRVQLAGCGVAAMCDTWESMEKQRVKKGDYGWSASYEDVIRCVETEIRYREALEKIASAFHHKDFEHQPGPCNCASDIAFAALQTREGK